MDVQYGVTTFTDKLKDIEKIDFVSKTVSDYIDIVDKLLKKDHELQRELENLKGKTRSFNLDIFLWFWLIKTKKVYLLPPNRKYIVSNVSSNAISNVNVKLNLCIYHVYNAFLIKW